MISRDNAPQTAPMAETKLKSEIARLHRQNHALTLRLSRALEAERKQIARELHDELGQSLTAIKTDAVLISNRSRETDPTMHASAQAILDTVSRVYEVVYSMMRRLRPAVLDELGLGPALETLVAEWHKRQPWTACTLDLAPDLSGLDDLINITVYRAIQESLTNAARHSAATRVTVAVAREPAPRGELLRVTVEDNGRGPGAQTETGSGRFGLRGLAERVLALGGRFDLGSATGQGMKVSLWLPIKQTVNGDTE